MKHRNLYIRAHMYAAAFLAPVLVLVALSGGLYLLGIKGTVSSEQIPVPEGVNIDLDSASLEGDVRALLNDLGVQHDFEYLKVDGSTLYTRPTSNVHHQFDVSDDSVAVQRNHPDLQKRMIELHKGHGPTLFKHFQKIVAVGLLYVVLNGLWLGISSAELRLQAIVALLIGLGVFLALIFLA